MFDMLNNVRAMTTLPATDLKRAKKFYEKLGLKTSSENEWEVQMSSNGSLISIYKREQPTRADHTVLTFEINNIENEVSSLEKNGVRFEDYNLPDLKTEKNHIATMGEDRAAWFKDTEGNILCIHEGPKK